MEPARARWLNFSREGGQEHGALPSPWLSSGLSHLHPIPVEVDETQQSRENITKCPSSLVVRCGQVNYPDRQSPAYVGRPYRGPGDSHCEAPPSPKRASWGPAGLGPARPRRRSAYLPPRDPGRRTAAETRARQGPPGNRASRACPPERTGCRRQSLRSGSAVTSAQGQRKAGQLRAAPRWPDPAPQKSAWDGHSILPSPQQFTFFLKKKKMFSK